MKACFIRNKILSASVFVLIWWVLSLIYPPIVIPSIPSVIKSIGQIFVSKTMWLEIGRTFYRLFFGLFFGVFFGGVVGFFCGTNKVFRQLCISFINVLQVVPPVSILILTIIWLGYNGKPAIAISAVAIFPTIVICVQDAILNLDKKLLEMAKVFKFSKSKQIKKIIWPSIKPQVYSALKIAVGTASKTIVMGEVLTTVSGIGGQIVTARLNIESEMIIAWTVVAVAMYFVYDKVCALFFDDKKRMRTNADGKSSKSS